MLKNLIIRHNIRLRKPYPVLLTSLSYIFNDIPSYVGLALAEEMILLVKLSRVTNVDRLSWLLTKDWSFLTSV